MRSRVLGITDIRAPLVSSSVFDYSRYLTLRPYLFCKMVDDLSMQCSFVIQSPNNIIQFTELELSQYLLGVGGEGWKQAQLCFKKRIEQYEIRLKIQSSD